ncbi:Cytosolic carboxypeptidase 2 [Desmophyllum pertusum]|uniref:Cytosolic carboxypeptidase 2 n=1 Tax=Desmophyllum pertusum TaxID=174260 RepID=A0A9X0CU58_9CNID|nr:Cytosolic carboxypeptidase 2 [Desmophyllum pertusum]
MEATFCGSSLGKRAGYHFNTSDFESMDITYVTPCWITVILTTPSTGGSDSSVSDGLPMHLIYAPEGLKMESRKKKLKTRKERNKRRAKAMKVKDVLLADVATRICAAPRSSRSEVDVSETSPKAVCSTQSYADEDGQSPASETRAQEQQ